MIWWHLALFWAAEFTLFVGLGVMLGRKIDHGDTDVPKLR